MKNRLRDLRTDKDAFLEKVAHDLGITISKLSRIETGIQPAIDNAKLDRKPLEKK